MRSGVSDQKTFEKSPSRVQDGNEGVAGRKKREKSFTTKGFDFKQLIYPIRQSKDLFNKKEIEKN